jgi:hypothetical protein
MAYNNDLTPEEVAEWGPEFVSVLERKARSVAAAETASLRQQLAALQQTAHKNARQEMMRTLDQTCVGWRQTNELPEFRASLEATRNPMSNNILYDELLDGWKNNRTSQVREFFERWQNAYGTPVQRQPDNRPVVQGPRGFYRSNNQGAGQAVTQSEIKAHYRRSSEGVGPNRYYKTETDRMAAEMSIHQRATRYGVVKG